MIKTNLKLVRESIEKARKEISGGAEACRDEMMSAAIQLSKEQIKGRRPEGQRATAGQPPMNRSGNLRRSIRGEKRVVGFAQYTAIVGPTIVYGRAVELGGEYAPRSWKGTSAMAGFPYMRPGYEQLRKVAPNIIRKNLSIFGGK
jgi:phage gpG-like protein